MCRDKIYNSTTKVKVTIEGHRFVTYKSCVRHNSKGNLIKLHRKVKQNEKVCYAQNQGTATEVKVTTEGYRFVTYEPCVSHNGKIDKGNLIKLHRKVKHNEEVCRAQPGSRP